MEHAGQKLSADLVHGRNHQHQALRGGVGGGQGAGLQRTVAGTGGAGFGLHLNHIHSIPEDVLFPLGGPFVHLLRHNGGRRDWENSGNLRKRVRGVCGSGVAVHDYTFLTQCFHFLPLIRLSRDSRRHFKAGA
ncbi:hypothetical protein SDC9_117031 [bioreactor metagenome]|uniref:Uncharacterized protein n=1 Tax=bioreactor metagenome TaxID=1076179 RepID=A0A645BX75_9ZZZZ